MPTVKEIAEAVWDSDYATPSTLVDRLGKTTTMKRLVAFAARNVDLANSNVLKNRDVLAAKIADAIEGLEAPIGSGGTLERSDVEAAIRDVLGSLNDEEAGA